MRSTKKFGILLICVLFALSLCIGCSQKEENEKPLLNGKDPHQIYEKVVKEKEKTHEAAQNEEVDVSIRKKQMAASDACLAKYNSCLDKCNSSSCEYACQDALSVCEKDLPMDLKTIKE